MATKIAPRRISAIRHVDSAGSRSAQSPLAAAAMIAAITIAIALLSVTISAAQAMQ